MVATLPWNRWPDWSGLGGHFGLEYASGGDRGALMTSLIVSAQLNGIDPDRVHIRWLFKCDGTFFIKNTHTFS